VTETIKAQIRGYMTSYGLSWGTLARAANPPQPSFESSSVYTHKNYINKGFSIVYPRHDYCFLEVGETPMRFSQKVRQINHFAIGAGYVVLTA
jgi:hypothetical protein